MERMLAVLACVTLLFSGGAFADKGDEVVDCSALTSQPLQKIDTLVGLIAVRDLIIKLEKCSEKYAAVNHTLFNVVMELEGDISTLPASQSQALLTFKHKIEVQRVQIRNLLKALNKREGEVTRAMGEGIDLINSNAEKRRAARLTSRT